jgi:hypothetical protein
MYTNVGNSEQIDFGISTKKEKKMYFQCTFFPITTQQQLSSKENNKKFVMKDTDFFFFIFKLKLKIFEFSN